MLKLVLDRPGTDHEVTIFVRGCLIGELTLAPHQRVQASLYIKAYGLGLTPLMN